MGISASDNGNNTANQQAGAAPTGAPGDFSSTGGTRAPSASDMSLYALSAAFNFASSLDQNAQQYLDTVKEMTEKMDFGPTKLAIKMHRLTEPQGTYAFVAGKFAVILMFMDVLPQPQYMNQPYTPKSVYINRDIVDSMKRANINAGILNVIMVGQHDYARPQQMVNEISKLLMAANMDTLHTAQAKDFFGGQQINIDHNVDVVRQLASATSPHGVQARIDAGFTVYLRNPNKRDNNQLFGQVDQAAQPDNPIMVVGGYTDIVRVMHNGLPKFQPIFVITTMNSMIPHTGMAVLGVALAAQEMCARGNWQMPYRIFQKGRPNLGNVHTNEDDGKLYSIENAQAMELLLARDFLPPQLAVSVAEGRSRMPAIAQLVTANGASEFAKIINHFFNTNITIPATTLLSISEIIGTISTATGMAVDSREGATYLDIVARMGAMPLEDAQLMMNWWQDPSIRAKIVANYNGSFTPLHLAQTAILHPQFVTMMAQLISSSGLQVRTNSSFSQAMDMSILLQSGAEMLGAINLSGSAQPSFYNNMNGRMYAM